MAFEFWCGNTQLGTSASATSRLTRGSKCRDGCGEGGIIMKFTDGNWLMQKGVQAHYPGAVHEAELGAETLTLYVPCKTIHNRGNTLDGPLLTVRFSAPAPGVIRVQTAHYTGARPVGPAFALREQAHVVRVEETNDEYRLTTDLLSVRVAKAGAWRMDFYHGEQRITSSGGRALAYIDSADDGSYMREQLQLGVGETVYGLGEHFTSFVKNGQTVEIWNEDGGTGTQQAYKNVPIYLTNRGYGVFVNHPERVSFEVASERVSRVQFSVGGESLDYMVIAGPTPKAVLERYTALTGRPALPPAWSFGLWLSTSFTTNYDEATVNHFVDGMAERQIPLHVFHFDCFWMKEFEWCNFTWDDRIFPDPVGMLQRLHDKGLHICVWINPYIAQKSPLFAEGAANGYLLRRPDGNVWQWDLWQAGMGIVDFTNPAACDWYAGYLRRLLEMGVDTFKTDFGERIPTDVVYFDHANPQKMHNYYTQLYNQVVFNVLKEHRGEGEAVLFARSATAGGQQFPVHWGGDCSANYESMAESLRGGLSLGLSGFGFWSHDIGGFENTSTADVYKRWAAFGLLSSHSRLHGSSSYRVPWAYDDEAVDVVRHFVELKCSLMPYLFATAVQATTHGTPVMRAMLLEFPDDPATATLDLQYMLGDSLLVAPVFRDDGSVTYYLPAGTWTHALTNAVVEGGGWHTETYDYHGLPLFIRANAVIAVGARTDRPDYDFTDGVTFHVSALADGARASTGVPDVQGRAGMTCTVERRGNSISCTVRGSAQPWALVLRTVQDVAAVVGGRAVLTATGLHIEPEAGVLDVVVTLR